MVQVNNYTVENFDPEVLREYDIRGVVGENINENTAYTIGRTFGLSLIHISEPTRQAEISYAVFCLKKKKKKHKMKQPTKNNDDSNSTVKRSQ